MIVISVRPALLRGALRDDPASFPDVPEFFIAHELAHQWWGHGVTGQNYHERWISEAFAQYAAALWVRHSRRARPAFRNMLSAHGPLGAALRGQGPPSTSATGSATSRAIPRSCARWSTTRGRTSCTCSARSWARRRSSARSWACRPRTASPRSVRTMSGRLWRRPPGLDLRPYFAEWVYGTAYPSCAWPRTRGPGAKVIAPRSHVHGRDLPGPVPLEVAVAPSGGDGDPHGEPRTGRRELDRRYGGAAAPRGHQRGARAARAHHP